MPGTRLYMHFFDQGKFNNHTAIKDVGFETYHELRAEIDEFIGEQITVTPDVKVRINIWDVELDQGNWIQWSFGPISFRKLLEIEYASVRIYVYKGGLPSF